MIPKIIHQLWIGPKPAPTKFMDTWKDKNPDFEYIRWNEEEIKKRNLKLECVNRIDEMEEINGKADIIRWEILYEYASFLRGIKVRRSRQKIKNYLKPLEI